MVALGGWVVVQVWLGAKRTISVSNLQKLIRADLVWDRLFPLLARFYGYVPVKKFKLGKHHGRHACLP